jgi:hypothetical protein
MNQAFPAEQVEAIHHHLRISRRPAATWCCTTGRKAQLGKRRSACIREAISLYLSRHGDAAEARRQSDHLAHIEPAGLELYRRPDA